MANTRATTLPPYNVLLPEIGADDDTWGNALNGNWNIFSTELQRVEVDVDAAQSAADAAQTDADAAKAAADAAQATANTAESKADAAQATADAADGKADANTANKVAKAGDTMSGNLSVPDGTDPAHAINLSQIENIESIGVGQTWQTVSRSVGVNYQNDTGRPIQVACQINGNNGQFVVGANNPADIVLFSHGSSGAGPLEQTSQSFIIPPGWWYRFTGSSAIRAELR